GLVNQAEGPGGGFFRLHVGITDRVHEPVERNRTRLRVQRVVEVRGAVDTHQGFADRARTCRVRVHIGVHAVQRRRVQTAEVADVGREGQRLCSKHLADVRRARGQLVTAAGTYFVGDCPVEQRLVGIDTA